jgi:DNA helicase-2/ATP-dependent DNA helicase PcrA
MNKPTRYVSRKAIGAWRAENPCLEGMRVVPGLNEREREAMLRLYSDIRNVQIRVKHDKLNTRQALEEVLSQIDYVKWARENLQDDPQDDDLEATLNALRVECDGHPVPSDFFKHVRDQRANAQRKRGKQGTGVLFSTFHGVKGLEWPHVILTGMSDRWMPHRRAKSERAQEEERRLAHVGLTRTQGTVCITMPGTESMFVTEWKSALKSGSPQPSSSPA